VIRALLVDDHQIVRSGVRKVLEATGRIEVVGEAAGVAEALERAGLLRPDVVVLDLTLRDGSGLDAIAELRAAGARVVILSMQDEPAYARKAFELGAQGYVVKDAADEELADAIDAVLGDRIYVHPALAARLVMGEPEDDLTERERQILRLIALGYTNQEISDRTGWNIRRVQRFLKDLQESLENEGDRLQRDGVASLFAGGIDPMFVIRWKDIFAVLEEAIDATEKAAQILEGIVIKNS